MLLTKKIIKLELTVSCNYRNSLGIRDHVDACERQATDHSIFEGSFDGGDCVTVPTQCPTLTSSTELSFALPFIAKTDER